MVDMSKLSDADLDAIANGDMSAMSDAGLALLAGTEQPEQQAAPQKAVEPVVQQESDWYSPERIAANPAVRLATGAASPILGAMELIPGDIGRGWAARNAELKRLQDEGIKQQGSIVSGLGLGSELTGSVLSPAFLKIAKALPTAKSIPTLAGQGAGVGAAAGLTAPTGTAVSDDVASKLEHGAFGLAVGGVATPAGVKAAQGVSNALLPIFSSKAAEKGAARQLIEVSGKDEAQAVADKLAMGQPVDKSQIETAGQILSGMNNPKISALQKYWQDKFGSVSAYRNDLAQKDLEVARIKLLGAKTQPERQAALDEANRITRAFTIASKKGTDYREEAANLASQVKHVESLKQSAAEKAIMLDSASQARSIAAGMPRVGGRNISRAQELIDVGERSSSNFAKDSLRAGASARLAENIVGNMEARGLKPLSAESFISSMTAVRDLPSNVTNDSLRLLSNRLIKSVERAAAANNGVLDAASLDTLRRTSINDFIDSVSRGNPAQAKKLSSNEATESFKKFLDEAIEKAGGKGYSDYMRNYSARRSEIESSLKAMEKSDEMAQKGMGEIVRIMNDQQIHGLGLLERVVTIAQAFARASKGISGKKVGQKGAELMTNNPKRLGYLMQKQLSKPQGMLGESVKYQGGVIGGMLGGLE